MSTRIWGHIICWRKLNWNVIIFALLATTDSIRMISTNRNTLLMNFKFLCCLKSKTWEIKTIFSQLKLFNLQSSKWTNLQLIRVHMFRLKSWHTGKLSSSWIINKVRKERINFNFHELYELFCYLQKIFLKKCETFLI